ncbi:hypothetical protein TNCV_995691 [Trichonephila clavipes]|nr:hypothetical protein TNCV_995691 [Trichonephila clavipes]
MTRGSTLYSSAVKPNVKAGVTAHHQMSVTTVDELWHHVEAAWTSVPMHAIQSLLDSISRGISAVITLRGDCFGY